MHACSYDDIQSMQCRFLLIVSKFTASNDVPGISDGPAIEYHYKWLLNCSDELPTNATVVKDGKEVSENVVINGLL